MCVKTIIWQRLSTFPTDPLALNWNYSKASETSIDTPRGAFRKMKALCVYRQYVFSDIFQEPKEKQFLRTLSCLHRLETARHGTPTKNLAKWKPHYTVTSSFWGVYRENLRKPELGKDLSPVGIKCNNFLLWHRLAIIQLKEFALKRKGVVDRFLFCSQTVSSLFSL